MTTFDDEYAAQAAPDLQGEYGETITYYPRAGGTRSIVAIVNRNPLEQLQGADGVMITKVTLRVLDNSTTGISMAEWDSGGDAVTLAVRQGESAERLTLDEFISDNGGMNTFGAK